MFDSISGIWRQHGYRAWLLLVVVSWASSALSLLASALAADTGPLAIEEVRGVEEITETRFPKGTMLVAARWDRGFQSHRLFAVALVPSDGVGEVLSQFPGRYSRGHPYVFTAEGANEVRNEMRLPQWHPETDEVFLVGWREGDGCGELSDVLLEKDDAPYRLTYLSWGA